MIKKINFVVDYKSHELEELLRNGVDRCWELFQKGDLVWVLQTYVELRNKIPCSISKNIKPGVVNIVHATYLRSISPVKVKDCLIISVRADKPKVKWADIEVVQNHTESDNTKKFYITHWPQPGLIKRNEQREVKNVAFFGNHNENGILANTINKKLRDRGIKFSLFGREAWNDYSNVDISIGIRAKRRKGKRHNNKPPTKLINSWHAGVVFIGGEDSAYEKVGEEGKNYLKARSLEELVGHVISLQENSALYNSMLENGYKSSLRYTRENISEEWVRFLTGPVFEEVERKNKQHKHVKTYRSLCFFTLSFLDSWIYQCKIRIKKFLNRVITK